MGPPAASDARILIVDDEPANLLLLRRVLERSGYQAVHATSDPRQTVPLIAEVDPDLVILDLNMPHVDGFETLSRVVAMVPPGGYLPVLVITADGTAPTRERALSSGARDFLTKPFDFGEVILRVGNLLETRRLHLALAREATILDERVRERTLSLERALAQAEAAARARTQFVANISHELRTPITALRGSLGLLGKAAVGALSPRAARLLAIAMNNTERLVRAVEDLLRLQMLGAGEVHPGAAAVDLRALAEEVAARHARAAADRGLRLSVEVPAGLDPLETDHSCLADLLSRLVDNAVRFTDRGSVRIRVNERDGAAVAIEVIDTGPGLDPGLLPGLFEPFEQADNSDTRNHGGLGLGLAIAKAIAQLLGYGLRAESNPGLGATFVVDLRPPSGAAATLSR